MTGQIVTMAVGFDAGVRDRSLGHVLERWKAAIARGERMLLVGDFNVAPTEPAYRDLAAGLRDVHVEVGLGPGWTWRPARFEGFGVGLLRIDMAFTGPGLVPRGSAVDCGRPGDHCLLFVTVEPE